MSTHNFPWISLSIFYFIAMIKTQQDEWNKRCKNCIKWLYMCFKCRFWCIKCHFVFFGILCTALGISCIFESLFMSAFYNESAGMFLVLKHYIIPSRTQNLLLVSTEKNFTKGIPFFTNLVSLKTFFLHRYFFLQKTWISVKNVDLIM